MLQPTSCGPGPPLQQPPLSPPPTAIQTTTRTTTATKATRTTSQGALKEQLQQLEYQRQKHQKKKNKQQQPQQHQRQQQQQLLQQHRMNATNSNEIDVDDCSKKLLNNRREKVNCWQQHVNNNSNNSKNIVSTASKNFTWKFVTTTMTATVASKWTLWLLVLLTCMAVAPTKVTAEKSKHYYMQSLCKNHFLQQLYRKIDGAVLWSQNERNLDCIITFQTHSILQHFMLRFDMLQLDCNDHLYVYDGAHAVSTPKVDISCRNTKQTVSLILTRTNFVTLKYVTDGWGTDANGFKLVITSVKDPKHTCKDFTCATREFCIHPDLLCDGINHCGDNSDESVHNLCHSQTSSTIMGLDMTWFVLIVVCSLLILSACIVGWSICICRRGTTGGIGIGSVGGGGGGSGGGNINQNTALQMHHAAASNGSSKHLHQYHHHGTLTREHTTLSPPSGNWHHPAGPSGYHRIMQHNLLKMATKVRPIWCWANFVN